MSRFDDANINVFMELLLKIALNVFKLHVCFLVFDLETMESLLSIMAETMEPCIWRKIEWQNVQSAEQWFHLRRRNGPWLGDLTRLEKESSLK